MAVALSLPYTGCSLMNLDEIDARSCTSDLECAAAQLRAGLDATLCGHCTAGRCDFQHRDESCNGQDDDCDGLIDEDVDVTPRRLTGIDAPSDAVAFATAADGSATTFVAIAGDSRQGFKVAEDGTVSREVLRYTSGTGDPDFPCPYLSRSGELGAMKCKFTELALAVDTEHVLYAGINLWGCAEGQLRVGLADRRDDPFNVWLGDPVDASPTSTSKLALGVDVNGSCSGKSLPVDATANPGARGPAMASISTEPGAAGALVAWLGVSAGVKATACDETRSVPVQSLGIYVPEGAEKSLFGTDDGMPVQLGKSTSLAPPAVIALASPHGEPSFVVGFASDDSGERGVRLVKVLPRERKLLVAPLAFIHTAFAERVVLSLGEDGPEGQEIGVLWTAPCESPPALHFTRLPTEPSAPAASPLTLETSLMLHPPQLLYQPEGFSRAAPQGGWFVLWAQQGDGTSGEVKLARLLESAREPLNVVTLSTGTVGFPLVLPSTVSSVHEIFQSGNDERHTIDTSVRWCGVRG